MIIATKVRFSVKGDLNPDPRKPNDFGLSRKHILDAVEDSLKRLQTDYIDLYQVTNFFHHVARVFLLTLLSVSDT